MHVEHGLIDIIRSAAMVVDDDDAADGFEQRLAFDLIGPVCVDDDEQALRIGREQSLLPRQEKVVILRKRLQLCQQLAAGVGVRVHDDVGLLALLAAQARNARCRAERIEIGHFMAHDEHAARLCDELGKGRGHHTGFDLRAALRLLRAPAEEREVIAVLDDGLIAAAGQRHFNG